MRTILAIAMIAMVSLSSCLKQNTKCTYNDSPVVAPESEVDNLADSLSKYGITGAQTSPAGFMYKIKSEGSGPVVSNLCSYITVDYKGMFFNGKVFDSTATNQPAFFQLGNVITGWQKGIPLVKAGGELTLYIPPTLGYGNTDRTDREGNVVIPKNSYLVFDVKVLGIQ